PAKWLYYNLLDGDPASNNLSWQWVAGTFSRKKYYANQRNINKYSKSKQYDTFLDIEYHEFKHMKLPNVMEKRVNYEFNLSHMNSSELEIDKDRPTLIYSMFGLDTEWHPEMDANRVMVIEPEFLNDFPINAKRLDFIMKCIENNFDNLQLYYGDFESMNLDGDIRINSHPSNFHFKGKHENVNWLFPKTSDKHQSLMQYWRDAKSFVKDLLV
ncbi:MAG: deoxyribodipyrimidine photolyase, partial [Candidatus Heimdallarchaeota archaeon]|nr:deoxyribodipyrimidine photolyase [Candidatus Heimdallarchaeota archaeon]